MTGLTEREAAFAAGVAAGKSGTQAAKDAGYAAGSAAVRAARLIRKAKVAGEIERLRGLAVARIEEETGLTLARLIDEASHAALLDPAQMYDEAGVLLPLTKMPEAIRRAIASIEVEEKFIPGPGGDDEALITVRVHKVKFWDKPRSIELTAKLRGDLKPADPANVTNNFINIETVRLLSDDELRQVRASLASSRKLLEGVVMPAKGGKRG